jgi:hypothetical protein
LVTTQDITLIDRFINEELSAVELHKFQERVSSDYEFSQEVRTQISAVKGVRAYAALRFMAEIKREIPSWKEEGYKAYSPSMDTTKIFLRIFVPAIILGLSYFIFTIVDKGSPQKSTPKEAIVVDTVVVAEVLEKDTANMVLMNIVLEGDTSDTQYEVWDPSSFKAVQISTDSNVFVYELQYDGKTDTIRSEQDSLVNILALQLENHKTDSTISDTTAIDSSITD